MQASPDGLYIETMSGQDIIFYNNEDINYKRINMTIALRQQIITWNDYGNIPV